MIDPTLADAWRKMARAIEKAGDTVGVSIQVLAVQIRNEVVVAAGVISQAIVSAPHLTREEAFEHVTRINALIGADEDADE